MIWARWRRGFGDSAILPRGQGGGPMPWIVAIMTCLAMLGLAAALVLGPAASALSGQIAGRATIQIVEPDPIARREAVQAIRETLPDAPFVRAVQVVPEEELRAMASRWLGNGLGNGVDGTGIALPALIDVDLVSADAPALARLQSTVRSIAPQARVIPHTQWLDPVAGLMRSLGWMAGAIALALVLVAASVAVLTARAGLAAQAATIDIVHLVGATDVQIARLFQRHVARDALGGAALGALAAAVIAALLLWQFSGVESGLLSGGSWWPLLLPLALPVLIIATSIVSARLAVLASLRRRL